MAITTARGGSSVGAPVAGGNDLLKRGMIKNGDTRGAAIDRLTEDGRDDCDG